MDSKTKADGSVAPSAEGTNTWPALFTATTIVLPGSCPDVYVEHSKQHAHTGNRTPVTSMKDLYDATTLCVRLHYIFTEGRWESRSLCSEEEGSP